MFEAVCSLLMTFVVVVDCGRYIAPDPSDVTFPYRRIPTIRELVEDGGYEYDRYNVTTEDGHILALHRLSGSGGNSNRGVPVLLINGFGFQSDGWFLLGNNSLPFVLAGLGYDVWLGDYRGCARSLGHVKYPPQDFRANNYTIHELGMYDLPGFIDNVLEVTRKRKLLFVGMSLGAAILFVLGSEKPEYNEKILGAALMAPAGHLVGFEDNDLLYRWSNFLSIHLVNGAIKTGNLVMPPPEGLAVLKRLIMNCHSTRLLYASCTFGIFIPTVGSFGSLDPNVVYYQMATGMTTMSMRVARHLQQLILLGRFCKFNYGFDKNLEVYGHEYPPTYDLSRTVTPVFLIHGGNDLQVREQSAKRTGRHLGNLKKMKMIQEFSHADFQAGLSAPKLVYEDTVDYFDSLVATDADDDKGIYI